MGFKINIRSFINLKQFKYSKKNFNILKKKFMTIVMLYPHD